MKESHFLIGYISDYPDNSMNAVRVAEQEFLLIHQEGKFYVLPNQCTHARFPLDDGELLEGKVKCQYHGASFDLETGKPSLPAVKKIKLYTTKVEDDKVFVLLQEN